MSTTDKDRRSAWKALAMSPAWSTCEQDLLLFVSSERAEGVRCGRQDVVIYIRDSMIGQPDEEAV